MIDWLEKTKAESAKFRADKKEAKKKAKVEIKKTFNETEKFFDTLIYGIVEDVSSETLHVTISKDFHETTLKYMKMIFPDKDLQTYYVPLSHKLDIERINRNLHELMMEED